MPRLAPVPRATLPERAGSSVMVRVLLVERSAGDVQHLTGDESGRLAREEGDGVGDVVGLAHARDRDLGGGRGLELLEAMPTRSAVAAVMSVAMKPGATALAVMPNLPS